MSHYLVSICSADALDGLIQALGYSRISFWIVVTAAFVNVACAVLGCFLVLRRMSMLGDAISHAILPGIAMGFIFSGSRAVVPMLLGALAVGVLTALLTQALHRFARVPEDAAMGVVFTTLFALGIVLIHGYRHIDLDPDCVLYGLLVTASKDTVPFLGMEVARPALNMGLVCLLVIAFVVLLWKELKIVSFDPDLATTQGIPASVIHYLLMAMVATVTVTAFEAVGSILVVAMLIVPGATAALLTERMWAMVVIAAIIGIVSAVVGRDVAAEYRASVAGMMAVVCGGIFVLAVLLAPRQGLVVRLIRHGLLTQRIIREDILALLYRWSELSPGRPMPVANLRVALGGGVLPRLALWTLRRTGQVGPSVHGGELGVVLTPAGLKRAQTVIKSHRLWESYLQKVLGFAPDHVHAPADRTEHFLNADIRAQVAEAVAHPRQDPHGRIIPAPGENGGGDGGNGQDLPKNPPRP